MENLLNNQTFDSKQAEIFRILDEVNISDKNREIAVEFFDFSKEMNLELLKNVSFEGRIKEWKSSKSSNIFLENLDKKDEEYANRYILFLDAINLHTFEDMFGMGVWRKSTLEEYMNNNVIISKVVHALSLKYSYEMVQSKMAALCAGAKKDYSELLENTAKEDSMVLIRAAKDCCQESYIGDRVILYSFALLYMKTLEMYDEKDIEEIRYGIEFIKEQAKTIPLTKEEEFYNIMSAGFITIHHDKEIREIIEGRIKGNESRFLTAVLENVPGTYIVENMDTLFEMLNMEKSSEMVCSYIKTILDTYSFFNGPLSNSDSEPRIFLAGIAKKYPEQFVKIMNSTEKIKERLHTKECCCNYYVYMYKMLEEVNPESIKTCHVEFEADVVRLAAESEKYFTKKYKEKVFQFLCGEDNVFISDEDYEQLRKEYIPYAIENRKIVSSAIECSEQFKKRYYALKAVQDSFMFKGFMEESKNERIPEMLISEKLPMKTRFRAYERAYEYFAVLIDKIRLGIEKQIVETMLLHKNQDREYEKCCSKGKAFTRKVYLHYLERINENDKCKDRILAMSGDSSKEIRRLVVEIVSKHKGYEEDVLNLLKAKKQAVREVAVDILAIWGAENYAEYLLKAQENEKNAKLAEKISNIINVSSAKKENEKAENEFLPLVEKLHKGGRNKKILWLYEEPNKTIHFKNGREADERYMQALLLCYANMTTPGMNQSAILLTKELNEEELNQYSLGIFTKWKGAGAEAKKKWVLYFTSIHGGRNMIEVLLQCIKEWAENSRGAIAAEAVRALALNGSSEALMHVDNMAHKFKHKQVRGAAIEALNNAAKELGMTKEELADRIVPNLGFNEKMERIFDYGPRKFKVYLTPSLELEIFDEDNKKRKTMPAPSKKDDEETAKQSNAEFKQLKKQLKNMISIQKLRLESSLLADRRWTMEAWQNLFVKNPVMHSFAIGLIWAAYEEDKLVQTFRYMEDGSFNTSKEEEYTLSENTIIGLVHPIDLREEELLAWKEQLEDYEIIQPIKQLERNVYSIQEEEVGKFDLNRFHGRTISGMALLGKLEKLGWYKGSIQDAGWYNTFYREDVVRRIKKDDGTVQLIGNATELHFSGMGVGYYDDEEVTVENIRFYTPGTIKRGSYEYDEADDNKAMKLEQVNPRYLSEIINQLETFLKKTDKE